MRCTGCSFSTKWDAAPPDKRCMMCGSPLKHTSDDFLLDGASGLVREVRAGQVQMARIIENAIEKKTHAFVEGPVGIGKSYGYSIPSLLSGKRAIISTAKKSLQHQLARKDLPLLIERLGLGGHKVALMKGKSNYACRWRLAEILDDSARNAFAKWMDESEYGDITDYPHKRPAFWHDITAEECIGRDCRWASSEKHACGYWRAKQQMKAANIVIANHHIMAFDIRFGPNKILGDYEILIIDEAHQAESALRGAFSTSVHAKTYRRILKNIDKTGIITSGTRLEKLWADAFARIANMDGEIPADPFGTAGDELIEYLSDLNKTATKEIQEAGGDTRSEDEDDGTSTPVGNPDYHAISNLQMLKKSIEKPLDALRAAKEPGENSVVYITSASTDKNFKILNAAPISVGPLVGSKLRSIPTLVVTSATIAIGGSFTDIKRRLGLEDYATPPAGYVPPIEEVLETPFDYHRQALLYIPQDLPLPTNNPADKDTYFDIMAGRIARLIKSSDGNAFVLFSATTDLREVHRRLLEEDIDNPLIVQTDDAESALRDFMKTPRSVILGLKSFWEGVDVVGDKLRLVIITKLPFPVPSEPVVQARSRQFVQQQIARGVASETAQKMVFNAIAIPQMLIDLRQGAGRLIRSKSDQGVLAILDSRVWSGSSKFMPRQGQVIPVGYGQMVINALGFSQRTPDYSIVDRFLAMLRRKEAARLSEKKEV